MPKMQIACPRCRQPIMAEVRQVFDLAQDPRAKDLLLSGAVNIAQCPHCGFQGPLSTPLVYHDPDKELLLVYVPQELGMHRDQQEKVIGPLLNQIINNLPPEKRKAYLLQPQTMLTYERLIERILEADGITKEMLQAQEKRLRLIQRLMSAADDARAEIIRQEDALIDENFFAMLARLLELHLAQGDRLGAQQLMAVEKAVLEHSTFGQKLRREEEEVRAAVTSLQQLGPRATLDQLVDLVVQAPNDIRLQALVRLARPAMNYEFFAKLAERIEKAQGEEKERLTQLRDRLLELTQAIDKEVEARVQAVRDLLEQILAAENLEQAVLQALPAVDDFFLGVVEQELQAARQKGDLQRSARLNQVIEILQKVASPPPQVALLEALVNTSDPQQRQQLLERNAQLVDQNLAEALARLVAEYQQRGEVPQAFKTHLSTVHQEVVRFLATKA